MKNKVCIVLIIIIALMLAQFSVLTGNVNAVEMYGLMIEKPYNSYCFKVGENITDYLVYIDRSTGEKVPINWENIKVVNEVDNGVIEVDGKNAIVKREGKGAVSYYDGEEHGFTLEVTAVSDSTTIIGNPEVYLFIRSPIIKTQQNETEEIFTYLDMEPVDQDFDWDVGLPEVNLEWTVDNPQIAKLEETTKYGSRGIVIKPLKRGNTKLTCTVKVPKTGETIVKTAYIMVADENGNYDELVEDNTAPEILNIQVNEYTIKVEAKDGETGLAEKAYSLDGENWQSSNEFTVSKSGTYTIYVKDKVGNIATGTANVTDNQNNNNANGTNGSNDGSNNGNTHQGGSDNQNNNNANGTNGSNDGSNNGDTSQEGSNNQNQTGNENSNKEDDQTISKEPFGQYGSKSIIVAIIGALLIVSYVGYRKHKKYNY